MLFVLWLGGDVGVFVLGQNFRRRSWTMEQRLGFLNVLGLVDLFPRAAWALMAPISLTMVELGGWFYLPAPLLVATWLSAPIWLYLIWANHTKPRNLNIPLHQKSEYILKIIIGLTFLGLGLYWLWSESDFPQWLTMKAIIFSLVFGAAIMIDVKFRPLTAALHTMLQTNGSVESEDIVLTIMNNTRRWVVTLYVLLLIMAFLGVMKITF